MRKNIIIKKIALSSSAIVSAILYLMIFSTNATAAPVIGFNPGYIIDDSIFINSYSMSQQDIQNFLNSKVPSCDTYGTQTSEFGGGTRAEWAAARGYSPPFTCLKDYSENNLSAAQIIYNVSQQYQINPQVLIVLLQKEQGLVTDSWPLTIQYRSATGYGCPDTAPCDSQYYGLTNQITWSGKMFRAILNNSPTWYTPYVIGNNYIQYSTDAACGGSNVNIVNRATQALYNYTPYQPNQASLNAGWGTATCGSYGNRNFYSYFTNWFGTINYSKIPPLYKTSGSDTIYAIAENKKYPMSSFDAIQAYGMISYEVNVVSNDFISSFPDGTAISSTLAKKQNDPNGIIYLFDSGKRYPVVIEDCAKDLNGVDINNTTWKLDCFNSNTVQTLPNQLIDTYTSQDIQLPNIIQNSNTNWKIENGKKRRITDTVFINVLGGWQSVREMQTINAQQPEGKLIIPNGSIIKFSNSPMLYYLSDVTLYPIPSLEMMSYWGIADKKTYVLPDSYNLQDPLLISQYGLKQFAIDSSGTQYVLFPSGKKSVLPTDSLTLQSGQYSQLPDSVISQIPTISLPNIFRSEDGEIFIIKNGHRLSFPSVSDIIESGYSVDKIQPVQSTFKNYFTYSGLKLANGRLFKVTGSDMIRYVYRDGVSLSVSSVNLAELPYSKIISTDDVTGSLYPVSGNYISPSIYRSQDGEIFTIQNNNRLVFPTIEDIVNSGFRLQDIQMATNTFRDGYSYGGLKLANGRLFKVTGSDMIRYVYRDGVSLSLESTNLPGLPYNKLIIVDDATGSMYPVMNNYGS
ncbi:hypothetical protein HGB07_01120 [Candidatus Roizmanbacteria bacterium]|nr:hypothetical protein [Candidatus Roizmanbacteria bacterium]